nr:hypothetical protein [Acinetobacter baumannii]
MEPATFPINSYSGIVQVINYLNNNHSKAAAEGRPLVVRINQKEDDRSAAQNRLYWAWLEQIRQKTGNSKDDLHLLFKKKFLARIYVEGRQGVLLLMGLLVYLLFSFLLKRLECSLMQTTKLRTGLRMA